MKPSRFLQGTNAEIKLVLMVIVTVLLPSIVLSILSATVVRRTQTDLTELLYRPRRERSQFFASRVGEELRRLSDGVSGILRRTPDSEASVQAAIEEARRSHPWIGEAYLFSPDGSWLGEEKGDGRERGAVEAVREARAAPPPANGFYRIPDLGLFLRPELPGQPSRVATVFLKVNGKALLARIAEQAGSEIGRDPGFDLAVVGGEEVLVRPLTGPAWYADEAAPKGMRVAESSLPYPFEDRSVVITEDPARRPSIDQRLGRYETALLTWAIVVAIAAVVAGVILTLRAVSREMKVTRLKSDFVSFVTHELKTPLTSIRMFAETLILGRTKDKAEERECLELIGKETERLSRLIEQILELSKMERNQKVFRFESCDLGEVVNEAVEIFKDHNKDEEFEIEVRMAQNLSQIKIDRASIIELILNLLSNALKYSGDDKRIVVTVREGIQDMSVDVKDHGVGIRKRDRKRIFEKFYRADDYLSRGIEGTGLGLSFARYIARIHNGDIRVASKLDHGSTFTFYMKKREFSAS